MNSNKKEIVHMDFTQVEARVMRSVFDGLKMTSREISEVTGKEHKHVLRDIDVLISQGAILERNFALKSFDIRTGNGGTRKANEYILDFKATYVLILGYDAVRRAAVIDRWMALEASKLAEEERARAKKPVFKIPQTYLEALEAHLSDQKAIALL